MRNQAPSTTHALLGAVLALSSVATLAQTEAEATARDDSVPRATQWCSAIDVVAVPQTRTASRARGRATPSFAATEVQDLEIRVFFASLPADEHILQVRFLTPKGHHYQTLAVPITRQAIRAGTTRRLPGYRHALEVQQIELGSKRNSSAAVALPVAGTQISTNSLYGSWTVEAMLDDDAAVCASAQFDLTP